MDFDVRRVRVQIQVCTQRHSVASAAGTYAAWINNHNLGSLSSSMLVRNDSVQVEPERKRSRTTDIDEFGLARRGGSFSRLSDSSSSHISSISSEYCSYVLLKQFLLVVPLQLRLCSLKLLVASQYDKLYPKEPKITINRLRDASNCDLDEDFFVADVVEGHNDIIRAMCDMADEEYLRREALFDTELTHSAHSSSNTVAADTKMAIHANNFPLSQLVKVPPTNPDIVHPLFHKSYISMASGKPDSSFANIEQKDIPDRAVVFTPISTTDDRTTAEIPNDPVPSNDRSNQASAIDSIRVTPNPEASSLRPLPPHNNPAKLANLSSTSSEPESESQSGSESESDSDAEKESSSNSASQQVDKAAKEAAVLSSQLPVKPGDNLKSVSQPVEKAVIATATASRVPIKIEPATTTVSAKPAQGSIPSNRQTDSETTSDDEESDSEEDSDDDSAPVSAPPPPSRPAAALAKDKTESTRPNLPTTLPQNPSTDSETDSTDESTTDSQDESDNDDKNKRTDEEYKRLLAKHPPLTELRDVLLRPTNRASNATPSAAHGPVTSQASARSPSNHPLTETLKAPARPVSGQPVIVDGSTKPSSSNTSPSVVTIAATESPKSTPVNAHQPTNIYTRATSSDANAKRGRKSNTYGPGLFQATAKKQKSS